MKSGYEVRWGATRVALVVLVGMLIAGCAPNPEVTVRTRQHVINGLPDQDNPVSNSVVGLDSMPGWCTGTLITSTYVLTAAHCVVNSWGGSANALVGLIPGPPALSHPADGCWMHPLAYGTGSSNCDPGGDINIATVDPVYDLAIYRLATPVPRSIALPTRVHLMMPSGVSTFAGEVATIRGHGVTSFADGGIGQPATRMRGDTQIDGMGDTLWMDPALPMPWGGARATIGVGDSGGPLLWPPSVRPAIIGVASAYLSSTMHWAKTSTPAVAIWINNVLTNNSPSYTIGSTTGPSSGWLGEGADLDGRVSSAGVALPGDNCPNLFNPWQDDDDGDGIGNECDHCPGSTVSRASLFDHDADGDGVSMECGDTCPNIVNTVQTDSDGDGWGDACDLCENLVDSPRQWETDNQPNCNRNTEIEQSRPALGDRCDPYPCNPADDTNSSYDRIGACTSTPDPAEDHCVRGSDFVQVGYAPRVGVGGSVPWTPSNTAAPLTSPLWRCVCIRASDGAQLDDPAQCMRAVLNGGACPRDGLYRNLTTGHGWRHAAVDAPGWATLGNGLAQVWGAPTGTLAPRLSYITHWTRSAAAAWWRLQAGNAALSPITFWNWNWTAASELYPASMPHAQAFVPFSNPPRVTFWTRAQPFADPGDTPTSVPYRVARMQDSYTPGVSPLEEPHVIVVPRQRAALLWNIDLRAPPLPVGPFPCPTPLEELVTRFRPRVIPLTAQSPTGTSDLFFSNGSANDPTRGVAVALIDVRQGTVAFTAATGAPSAADLPVQSNLSFALSKMDAQGFPDVYAFGGRNADTSLSRDLYYTTHGYLANGHVSYKWHRVPGPGDLAARENSALVASADGQRMYVVGGRAGANLFADVWRYDLSNGRWMNVQLRATFPARYDATAVAMNDRLFIGGGVATGGGYLGDLLEIDGITGGVMNYGNVLPLGALPDLTFDQHYEGLIYGGGYYGSTWYRDLWTVRILGSTVTTSFVHDFGGDGLAATRNYAVVGDLAHNAFWAVPGYQWNGAGQKVWFLQDGVASSGGGTALRAATGGTGGGGTPTTTSPARQTNPRGAPGAVQVRSNRLANGIR